MVEAEHEFSPLCRKKLRCRGHVFMNFGEGKRMKGGKKKGKRSGCPEGESHSSLYRSLEGLNKNTLSK
jgi:hypothetical protein